MDLEYFIRTKADVAALEQNAEAIKKNIEFAKKFGLEAKAMEQELERVDTVLKSNKANLILVADGYEKAIAHTKAFGGESKNLEEELKKVNVLMGEQTKSAKESAEAFKGAFAVEEQYVQALKEKHGVLDALNPVTAEHASQSKIAALNTRELRDATKEGAAAAAEHTNVQGAVVGALESVATKVGIAAVAYASYHEIVKLATEAVNEYAAAQTRQVDQDAALANVGKLNDKTRESFKALAEEMENATNIANDKWGVVITTLTKKRIGSDDIEESVKAVEKLAGVMGVDINDAANIFTKAVDGNNRVLKRWGIDLSDTKDRGERLKKLTEELAGANDVLGAKSETITGRTAGYHNAVSTLLQTLGGWLAKSQLLQTTLQGLAWVTNTFTDGLKRLLIPILGDAEDRTDKLQNKFGLLGEKAEDAEEGTGGLAESLLSAGFSVDKASEKVKKLNEQLQKQLEHMTRIQALADAQIGEDLAMAVAGIDMQEAKGELSPAQANLARAQTRNQYGLAKEQTALMYDQQQRDQIKRTLGGIGAEGDKVANELGGAEGKLGIMTKGYESTHVGNVDLNYKIATSRMQKIDEAAPKPIAFSPREAKLVEDFRSGALNGDLADSSEARQLIGRQKDREKEIQRYKDENASLIAEYKQLEAIAQQKGKVKELKDKLSKMEEDDKELKKKLDKDLEDKNASIAQRTQHIGTLQAQGNVDIFKSSLELDKEGLDNASTVANARIKEIDAALTEGGKDLDPKKRAQLIAEKAQLQVESINRQQVASGVSPAKKTELEADKRGIFAGINAQFKSESEAYKEASAKGDGKLHGGAPVDPTPFIGTFQTSPNPDAPYTDPKNVPGVNARGAYLRAIQEQQKFSALAFQHSALPSDLDEGDVGRFEAHQSGQAALEAGATKAGDRAKAISDKVPGLAESDEVRRAVDQITAQTIRTMQRGATNSAEALTRLGEALKVRDDGLTEAIKNITKTIENLGGGVKNGRN